MSKKGLEQLGNILGSVAAFVEKKVAGAPKEAKPSTDKPLTTKIKDSITYGISRIKDAMSFPDNQAEGVPEEVQQVEEEVAVEPLAAEEEAAVEPEVDVVEEEPSPSIFDGIREYFVSFGDEDQRMESGGELTYEEEEPSVEQINQEFTSAIQETFDDGEVYPQYVEDEGISEGSSETFTIEGEGQQATQTGSQTALGAVVDESLPDALPEGLYDVDGSDIESYEPKEVTADTEVPVEEYEVSSEAAEEIEPEAEVGTFAARLKAVKDGTEELQPPQVSVGVASEIHAAGDYKAALQEVDPNRALAYEVKEPAAIKNKEAYHYLKYHADTGAALTQDDYRDLIKRAAKIRGIDEYALLAAAWKESSLGANQGQPSTSSAKGVYQFIDSTWKGEKKDNGARVGVDEDANVMDPVANITMGVNAFFRYRSRIKSFSTDVGLDSYFLHFMGETKGVKFLQKVYDEEARDADAVELYPAEAQANPNIFYKLVKKQVQAVRPDGALIWLYGGKPLMEEREVKENRTVYEVYLKHKEGLKAFYDSEKALDEEDE